MFDVCHQSESELARLQSDPLTPNAESQVAPMRQDLPNRSLSFKKPYTWWVLHMLAVKLPF